ncbi:MAG: Fur family transcriptional regulator, ferric uptake regulator [Actinomycetota bacterium]
MAAPTQLELETLLVRRGLRPTRQRLAVLHALAAEPNDATAQQIHARLVAAHRPVGLATVYRALGLLSEQGVVDALMHHPGETCYRLCSDGHHHHLVCGSCHRVVELGTCDLGGWLAEVGAEHGFDVGTHTFEVTGTCSDCRAST